MFLNNFFFQKIQHKILHLEILLVIFYWLGMTPKNKSKVRKGGEKLKKMILKLECKF